MKDMAILFGVSILTSCVYEAVKRTTSIQKKLEGVTRNRICAAAQEAGYPAAVKNAVESKNRLSLRLNVEVQD
ncbi:hypothetical protein D9M68_17820 [compost metagenome]